MKTELVKVTTDTLLGLREGVMNCRLTEFREYLNALIRAKESGIEPDAIPNPMMTDRVALGVDAGLTAHTKGGAEGGVEYKIFTIKGRYEKDKKQALHLTVNAEFVSLGAPDLERIKQMSVDDLRALLNTVGSNGGEETVS